MKKLIVILLFLFTISTFSAIQPPAKFNPKDCTCKGIKLSGYVRVATFGATFRVRKVNCGADLILTKYNNISFDNYASDCGDWTFVSSGENFTIEYVEQGEDFTIEFR